MNWLDIVIVLVVLFFAITAYRAGIIREVVTLLSVIVGVVMSGLFYDELATDVLTFTSSERTSFVVSFLVLFGATYLAGQLTAIMLKSTASLLLLGWADRIGGLVFGFLKGLIIVEILLIVFVTYPRLGLDDDIDGSAIASVFLDASPAVLFALPDEFETAVDAFIDET